MTQPARQLPDIEIIPIVPTKQELEWLEWQEKLAAAELAIWEDIFSVFHLPPELLNDEDIRNGARRP